MSDPNRVTVIPSDPVVHRNRNVTNAVVYLIDEGGWTSRSLLDPPLEGHVDKELQ